MQCKSYSHFFSKKFQHICISLDVNFNESLTNDIVSFEQLGPDVSFELLHVHEEETTEYELYLHGIKNSIKFHTGKRIPFQERQLCQNGYCLPAEIGSTLKGKNLLPRGAYSFL